MATLGIFARRPVAGAVKSRLAATVGAEAAAKFYEVSLRTLLTRLCSLAVKRVIAVAETAVSVSTFDQAGTSSDLQWFRAFEGFELWAQPPGDLGRKLTAWFNFTCAADDRVLVIGSDCPTLPMEFIEQAIRELETADCVIGPALDGGYYLLGLRRVVPELFIDIEWSSSRVLEQTLAKAREQKLKVVQLPPWNDIDQSEDLILLRDQLRGMASDRLWEPLRLEVEQLISDSRDSSHPGV